MNPEEQLAAEAAAIAEVGDRPMRPHPRGLAGRTLDAIDDAELVSSDPHASEEAKQSARALAAALSAALAAED